MDHLQQTEIQTSEYNQIYYGCRIASSQLQDYWTVHPVIKSMQGAYRTPQNPPGTISQAGP